MSNKKRIGNKIASKMNESGPQSVEQEWHRLSSIGGHRMAGRQL